MSSRSNNLNHQQPTVFSAVEESPDLLDLLANATSPAIKKIFIESLLEIFPTAFAPHNNLKAPDDLFLIFTTRFGREAQSMAIYPRVYAALKLRHMFVFQLREEKRDFIRDLGLDWTAAQRSSYFSKVNSACYVTGKSPIHLFPR